MKLLTMRKSTGYALGVKTDQGVLDIAAAAARYGVSVPPTVDAVIAAGEAGKKAVAELVQRALAEGQGTGLFTPEAEVVFGPCVAQPEKILCVGTNYRKHAIESNLPIPTSPVLFSKFNNALAGHNEAVKLPAAEQIDYEVELVIVIGREAKDVAKEDALSYVFGYATGNDLSARDLQFRTGQWLLGKTLDGFAPVGPYLVTADEVPNPNALRLELRLNGEVRQSSNTADMIFDCAELIHYASRYMTLKPGDLIFTGTPEGVILGYPEDKRVWLKAGDELVASVEGLGELRTVLVG
ncbi:fumarylacetoacetate hydrolase family protein [Alicyclobacillus macrosporangiidus]|uniref:2-keto-4-pentenoate hydratase/2-oxohepta-3-ene-1,7-dioic acid hydratase (Catechol pathway) n=1 Tax=Alicyclobacillus macrosporangiidus TaxID=392015 RepID=A0A1I7GZW8_9BACL|nr:fumarylacetoacetate hydrolase family protein [Alicyclobacillus macrosporangiidus]SFU54001.1 2-keto-4-pentenoate hydratase/2-oxohepta-3-ene-1,7-dioic acid hydratase (catechol pathway) [Alicyclobacillus macrosporangiidus]